jgi:hypothetical protein
MKKNSGVTLFQPQLDFEPYSHVGKSVGKQTYIFFGDMENSGEK